MAHSLSRFIAVLLLGGFGAAGSLSAQQIWLGSGRTGEVSVEILRPDLKSSAYGDQSFASVALFLSGRFPIGPKTTLVAELPWANGHFTYNYPCFMGGCTTESGSTLGDPYLGIEGGRDGSPVFGEFGVRFPLASESQPAPELVGASADLERVDAFAPKVATIEAFANYRAVAPNGFAFRLRGGPLAWVATQQYVLGNRDAELWFAYAVQAGYQSRSFTFLGGLGGRAILTEDVSNRFTDQLVFSAAIRVGGLRPGVSVRLPIDHDRDQLVGSAIGVSLSVDLR